MYQKYYTEALVLGNREHGENDRVYALYTKEFGLVRARASAVRSERSRMRYALQNYSLAQVALVRGKHGWRLGGAVALQGATGERTAVATFARMARLMLRLVAGEDQNLYLFAALREAHAILMRKPCAAWAAVEIVCAARVLHALGYLSAEALSTTLFTHTAYADDDLREAAAMQEKFLSSINKAIAETHL